MADDEHKAFIETSLAKIRKAHNENYLSIFAGAGISSDSDLPKWRELMDILRREICAYSKSKGHDDYLAFIKEYFDQSSLLLDESLIGLIKMLEEKLYDDIKRDENYPVLAEKFFNKVGKGVYYKKLRAIFKGAKPNALHSAIVKLNLKDLITTNWDDLFEQAVVNEHVFFDTIKKDVEIRSPTGLPKLIKMHGSLEEEYENIVFREKDYLEYSRNFPFIENYVKGVFSTDVVVLVGYSLSDPNVKQIISWVSSHSDKAESNKVNQDQDNAKTTYFIKTDTPFDPIEFEFYENRNIHVLYLRELFDKRLGPQEELKYFFERIKEYDEAPVLSDVEMQKIRDALIYFDFGALRERINGLEMSEDIPLKDKLLKCFLCFEDRIDNEKMPEIHRQCREVSEEAFKNREFKIWPLSEFNRYWGFYSSERKGHKEQEHNNDGLEEKFSRSPLSEKDKLKPSRLLQGDFDQQFTKMDYFLRKIKKDRSCWESGGFSCNEDCNLEKALQGLYKFDRLRIGNCLTIPRFEEHRVIYTKALECYWCEKSIGALRTKGKGLYLLQADKEIFSYSIRYFQTEELDDIFRYFIHTAFQIAIDQNFLEKIFTNICSKFEKYGAFTTRSSCWFGNFLFLASYCLLTQGTFDKIVEEVNHKIQARVTSLVQHEQLGKFVLEQSKNNTLSLQKCLDLVQSYLSLFVENNVGYLDIESKSIFAKITAKVKIASEECKNLITEFIDRVHQYVRIDNNIKPNLVPWLASNLDLKKCFKAILDSDEFQCAQYNQTFLPLIEALYQSSDEDVKKAIKDKLQYILNHKEDYPQTKASAKYCKWLEALIGELD
ncbi:SIR2 family protein [Helicobacter labacensis]|uniref:SIR2 family protein n=1 Tax=Helicobacter labacensis TaxID=2316079 RepID=UPI000EB03119|nr:SIR2 family protein [Helicobacter labacensis]